MNYSITLGWWIVPALITVWLLHWCGKQDYRGDYNFTALFTLPATGFGICLVWLIYTAIGWALA